MPEKATVKIPCADRNPDMFITHVYSSQSFKCEARKCAIIETFILL